MKVERQRYVMDNRTKAMLWVSPYFVFLLISVVITFLPFLIFLIIAGVIVFCIGWAMENLQFKDKSNKPND